MGGLVVCEQLRQGQTGQAGAIEQGEQCHRGLDVAPRWFERTEVGLGPGGSLCLEGCDECTPGSDSSGISLPDDDSKLSRFSIDSLTWSPVSVVWRALWTTSASGTSRSVAPWSRRMASWTKSLGSLGEASSSARVGS